jgi:hypothetical protein
MNGRAIYLCVILCFAANHPAWAQGERGFVRGLAGVTFGTAEASTIFGGGGGLTVGRGVQITGEFGRIGDVLPEELQDTLDLVSALLTVEVGVPIRLDVEASAFYGLAGARYTAPGGRIRPFGEAQGGLAHVSFDISAQVAGIDLSREVEEDVGLEGGAQFLLGLGGGVTVMFTDAVGMDVGYRYGRIFTDDPVINMNAVYGAVRFNFER